MAEQNGAALAADELRRLARECWAQSKLAAAFDAAWAAFDLDNGDRKTKTLLVDLLERNPAGLQPDRRAAYLALLTDREVEPNPINAAGWQLLLHSDPIAEAATDTALEALAAYFNRDELALKLLREAPVGLAAAELLVTSLRRWLLLSKQWNRYPEIVSALKIQASLNGGAWPFDEIERTRLGETASSPMLPAYLARREGNPGVARRDAGDPITRAVTAQYEGWPYPAWTRITRPLPARLPDVVRAIDPAAAERLPVAANMLIAGCGTGRQVARVALRFPDATVTAIDVSQASLDYARRQCAALGIANARFLRLDLHAVGELGQRFHAIYCGGVLHHLPDPERGWRMLVDVLEPSGVMRIMVYNKIARLRIAAVRGLIADLIRGPVSDDVLRQVRQRLLKRLDHPFAARLVTSRDFATLAGTHDLLLHRHEDPFDLSRIERALDDLGLRMLSFDLPTPPVERRYDAAYPHDRGHQDIKSWHRFEMDNFGLTGNYKFWCCRKSADGGSSGNPAA